jgi:DNA repair protein RadA
VIKAYLSITKSAKSYNVPNGLFRPAYELDTGLKKTLATGSKNLDALLSGGIETGVITQFYGGSYTGKTHLCHLLCVMLPLQYQALYIDTESSFREDRIKSIAKARGLDWTKTLKNIQVAKAHGSKEQESCIEAAYPLVKSNSNIKLLIVDSMTNHYRHEYAKLSNLPARQHTLNAYMHKLLIVAQTNKVAVVITNQVQVNPKSKSLNKEQIIGGNILSHISTYLVHLRRLDSLTVRAELQKSPNKGFDWHCLTIEESGFMDLPKPQIISDQKHDQLGL